MSLLLGSSALRLQRCCLRLEVLHGAVGLLIDNGDEQPELRLAEWWSRGRRSARKSKVKLAHGGSQHAWLRHVLFHHANQGKLGRACPSSATWKAQPGLPKSKHAPCEAIPSSFWQSVKQSQLKNSCQLLPSARNLPHFAEGTPIQISAVLPWHSLLHMIKPLNQKNWLNLCNAKLRTMFKFTNCHYINVLGSLELCRRFRNANRL